MAETTSDARALKRALKEALKETLVEQRELLHDVFAEVLEDFALGEAIREGQRSKMTSRAQVMRVLRAKS